MEEEANIVFTLPNCLPQYGDIMFKMAPEEPSHIRRSHSCMGELDETFHCILVEENNDNE